MRFVVTYVGRTLEFLDLEDRTLHLRPKGTLELTQKELDEIKDKDPELFGLMFVHEISANRKKELNKEKRDIKVVEKKKPVGRPVTKKKTKDSDPNKS